MQTVSRYEPSRREIGIRRLPDGGGLAQAGAGAAPERTNSSCDLQKLECRPSLSGRHSRELGAEPLVPDLLGAAAAFPLLVAAPIPASVTAVGPVAMVPSFTGVSVSKHKASHGARQHNNACVALSAPTSSKER
jgi:hypothetical protein